MAESTDDDPPSRRKKENPIRLHLSQLEILMDSVVPEAQSPMDIPSPVMRYHETGKEMLILYSKLRIRMRRMQMDQTGFSSSAKELLNRVGAMDRVRRRRSHSLSALEDLTAGLRLLEAKFWRFKLDYAEQLQHVATELESHVGDLSDDTLRRTAKQLREFSEANIERDSRASDLRLMKKAHILVENLTELSTREDLEDVTTRALYMLSACARNAYRIDLGQESEKPEGGIRQNLLRAVHSGSTVAVEQTAETPGTEPRRRNTRQRSISDNDSETCQLIPGWAPLPAAFSDDTVGEEEWDSLGEVIPLMRRGSERSERSEPRSPHSMSSISSISPPQPDHDEMFSADPKTSPYPSFQRSKPRSIPSVTSPHQSSPQQSPVGSPTGPSPPARPSRTRTSLSSVCSKYSESSNREDGGRRSVPRMSDFTLLKALAKGAFGVVYLARHVASGELFAIKVLAKKDVRKKNEFSHVERERSILSTVDCPFVVKLFCSFQTKQHLFLVMEYLQGGDMYSLLQNLGSLPETWARQYAAEIVLALEYLHTRHIIHRDIKPDNMVLDNTGHLKLTDFGLSYHGVLEPAAHQSSFHGGRSVSVASGDSTMGIPTAHAHPERDGLYYDASLLQRRLSKGSPVTDHSTISDADPVATPSDGTSGLPPLHNRPPTFPAHLHVYTDIRRVPVPHVSPNSGPRLSPGVLTVPYASPPAVTPGTLPLHQQQSPPTSISPLQFISPSPPRPSPPLHTPPFSPDRNTPPSHDNSESHDNSPDVSPHKVRRLSCVGTPEYLAPEILLGKAHGYEADWWALGICLFEFLTALPPFISDSPQAVFKQAVFDQVQWPDEDEVAPSPEAVDFVESLLMKDPKNRLGHNGAAEVKAHPWFRDVDWSTVPTAAACFVPSVDDPMDTSYFANRLERNPSLLEATPSALLDEAHGNHDSVLSGSVEDEGSGIGRSPPNFGNWSFVQPSFAARSAAAVAAAREAAARDAAAAAEAVTPVSGVSSPGVVSPDRKHQGRALSS